MAHIYTAPDSFTEQDNIRLGKLNELIKQPGNESTRPPQN